MFERRLLSILFLVAAVLFSAGTAAAQQSRCADCHFGSMNAPGHLNEWDRSAHGRNNVGCEKCHGGDATTFELLQAHRGIINSRNPSSPVNRRNLPQTCGACHVGQFVEFQKSKHYELLRGGNDEGPSCATCHGEVAANLPSAKGLSSQCAKCHGAGRTTPHPEFPTQAREHLEMILDVQAMLDQARPLIRRIKDAPLRARLQEEYNQAEVPLKEAIHAGHSFTFEKLEERHRVAQDRAEALLEKIANPAVR